MAKQTKNSKAAKSTKSSKPTMAMLVELIASQQKQIDTLTKAVESLTETVKTLTKTGKKEEKKATKKEEKKAVKGSAGVVPSDEHAKLVKEAQTLKIKGFGLASRWKVETLKTKIAEHKKANKGK